MELSRLGPAVFRGGSEIPVEAQGRVATAPDDTVDASPPPHRAVRVSVDSEQVAPRAIAMIESMRAYGYSLHAALADLIDNSITADAMNVWIRLEWHGDDSWIAVEDDGEGMDEATLRDAMRLGSRNPMLDREPRDLGRFGLGLKSASLSQCRRLTVASRKKRSEAHIRRWDLDYLAQHEEQGWSLLKTPALGSAERLCQRSGSASGTVVLWERMDRLTGNAKTVDRKAQDHFNEQVVRAGEWLRMTFHRYLAPISKRSKLRIHLQGEPLSGWDPFLEHHEATQPFPQEPLRLPSGRVDIKGFVLPHKDRLGDNLHKEASGPGGWNAQQGFYVYRNERLIVAGDWLGLGVERPWTKEEHYKLARIRLDLPNTMDHLWHLDVKKSSVSPPHEVRERLKIVADEVRTRAKAVYAHRGQHGTRRKADSWTRPWKQSHRGGRRVYTIDRDHPLIAGVLESVGVTERSRIKNMLRVIEETVPVEQIWIDAAEQPEGRAKPFEGSSLEELARIAKMTYDILRRHGIDHEEAIRRLSLMEEFADAQAILESLEAPK